MQQATPQLSVVVPCSDEPAVLDELHRRVSAVRHGAVGADREIVPGTDGSRDRTRRWMVPPAERDSRPVPVNPSRDHGPRRAPNAGLSVCRSRRVLVLDVDLHAPPGPLGPMMARMDAGADVVHGRCVARGGGDGRRRSSASPPPWVTGCSAAWWPATSPSTPGMSGGNPAVMGLTTRVVWGGTPPLGPPPAEPVSTPRGFAVGHALTPVPVSRAA